jgi:hypothetical protein
LLYRGGRAGNSDLMRAAFHPEETMAGYCQGIEYSGSTEHLFDWIRENGPDQTVVRQELESPLHTATIDELKWYFENRDQATGEPVRPQTQAFLTVGARCLAHAGSPRCTGAG